MSKHVSIKFKASDYWHPRYWPTWIGFALLRFVVLFPYAVILRIGKAMGLLIQIFSGKRANVVDINLALCFPDKPEAERKRIKRECYQNIGIALFEMAMCWWWSDKRLKPLVEIRGRENLDRVLERGQGAILLSGHFTSLEISGRLFSLSIPVQAMYRTQKNPMFDSYLYSKRSSYLSNVVSRKNTRQLIKGIRKLIPTWYAPDQNFRRERAVFAPFMGVPAATITAGSRLVQLTRCAMLPFYSERKTDGSGYILWIDPPLEDFPSGDDVKDATTINASIEVYVRRQPAQYMWIFQRFKRRPPGEPKVYP